MIDKIKDFYSIDNEWKVWSDRDKLYWTFTLLFILLIIIVVSI